MAADERMLCPVQGQFWYTDATAAAVAEEAVEAAGPSGSIACIACPSLFRQLRMRHPDAQAHLLEIDERFEVRYRTSFSEYAQLAQNHAECKQTSLHVMHVHSACTAHQISQCGMHGEGRVVVFAQALGNFAHYDYREPTTLPEELRHAFNVVVADPPYLVRSGPLPRRPAGLHACGHAAHGWHIYTSYMGTQAS